MATLDASSQALYGGEALPVGSKGRLSSGWWGMLTVIGTEASLFAYLLFSYFYVGAQTVGRWPPKGPPPPGLAIAGSVLLILGSLTMWWAERGVRAAKQRQLLFGLGASILLAIGFVVLEGIEWSHKDFTLMSDAYGSLYFTITGFHLLHVIIGALMLTMVLVWTLLGYFGVRRHSTVSIAALYWHFVTIVWVAVFLTFYAVPRLT